MDKSQQFIAWLCGVEGARFPFFRNMPEVPMPINYEEEKEKMVENETDKIIEEEKEDNEDNQENV